MPKAGTGNTQRKILLLLWGGLALGLSGSPNRYFKILKIIGKEWKNIERDSLRRAIRSLYQSQLVTCKENQDGMVTLVLTQNGQEKVLSYKIDEMKIQKPAKWDKKWRIVIFDIPENRKKSRDTFRVHLRKIGMLELQKSVFIHPYPCENEITFLTEFFTLRDHVRFVVADSLDNGFHFRVKFKLS